MKEAIQTLNAPKPSGPYSQGVKKDQFIFVSGQDGVQPGEDEENRGSIAEQTEACLDHIKSILSEKDADLNAIVHMTCHLADLNGQTVQEFNRVYEMYFRNVEVKPARITVGSQLLGTDVEITAIAAVE
ncbi:Rid family hydrolase [Lentibacillus juripiscarius]|uniref:Rid family hydrolase n=1 Tax=Lentibacillus juripiscarius TaxID=257446 RepID=UPI0036D378A1